ncbi:MAG: DoxX family membrane protein [Bacteroidetes bacterium]|nr:DoxX family membrane protein [Bacteroidota bacterium]
MRLFISNKYSLLFFRLVLGALFIFSGIEKITNPGAFAISIVNYKLVPLLFINFIAIVIPWLELLLGIFVLFGIETKETSALISVLLIGFTLMVIIALFRGLNIDCGCFGTITAEKVGMRKIMENLVFIAFSFPLIKYGSGKFIICRFTN